MVRRRNPGVLWPRWRVRAVVRRVRHKILADPLYLVEHHFLHGTWGQYCQVLGKLASKSFCEEITAHAPAGSEGMCAGIAFSKEEWTPRRRAVFYLFIDREARDPRQVLSHEALHAALAVMELIGHEMRKGEGSEPLTYYHDWLVAEGMEVLGGSRKRRQ